MGCDNRKLFWVNTSTPFSLTIVRRGPLIKYVWARGKNQVCLILKVILSVVMLSCNLNTSEDYWLGA